MMYEAVTCHLSKPMNYCQVYYLPTGLLIKFLTKSVEFKRVYDVNHLENKNFKIIRQS